MFFLPMDILYAPRLVTSINNPAAVSVGQSHMPHEICIDSQDARLHLLGTSCLEEYDSDMNDATSIFGGLLMSDVILIRKGLGTIDFVEILSALVHDALDNEKPEASEKPDTCGFGIYKIGINWNDR